MSVTVRDVSIEELRRASDTSASVSEDMASVAAGCAPVDASDAGVTVVGSVRLDVGVLVTRFLRRAVIRLPTC